MFQICNRMDGSILVYDMEDRVIEVVAVGDLLHYLYQTGRLISKRQFRYSNVGFTHDKFYGNIEFHAQIEPDLGVTWELSYYSSMDYLLYWDIKTPLLRILDKLYVCSHILESSPYIYMENGVVWLRLGLTNSI